MYPCRSDKSRHYGATVRYAGMSGLANGSRSDVPSVKAGSG